MIIDLKSKFGLSREGIQITQIVINKNSDNDCAVELAAQLKSDHRGYHYYVDSTAIYKTVCDQLYLIKINKETIDYECIYVEICEYDNTATQNNVVELISTLLSEHNLKAGNIIRLNDLADGINKTITDEELTALKNKFI